MTVAVRITRDGSGPTSTEALAPVASHVAGHRGFHGGSCERVLSEGDVDAQWRLVLDR